MPNPNPNSPRSVEKGTKPYKQYTIAEKYAALKRLQANGFNLEQTAREVGVVGVTIKKWRDEHPEVFKNKYADKALIEIETKMAANSKKLIDEARTITQETLEQIRACLPFETDMTKLVGLLKVIAPMGEAIKSGEANSGTMIAISSTLGKLAKMNALADIEIEDIIPEAE